MLHRDFGHITKANSLDYVYTGAERSAMIDRGILPLHMQAQRLQLFLPDSPVTVGLREMTLFSKSTELRLFHHLLF